MSQANHVPVNLTTWDAAKPYQQPASWGQGTVSMPTAPSADVPMSVDAINKQQQQESEGDNAPYAATLFRQAPLIRTRASNQ